MKSRNLTEVVECVSCPDVLDDSRDCATAVHVCSLVEIVDCECMIDVIQLKLSSPWID